VKFDEYIENNRLRRFIDPAMYHFIFCTQRWSKYAESIYSCEGHRNGEPAWIKFEVKQQKWWNNFKLKIECLEFCEVKNDTLYVYHKLKQDLFFKLLKILNVGDQLCRTIKLK
jgi:hypothetical protein